MKIWSIIFPAMLALTLSFAGVNAEAKRLGGVVAQSANSRLT